MKTKRWVTRFLLSFVIALAVTAAGSAIWSLMNQGQANVNWGVAVTLAFTLAAVSANQVTRGRQTE